MAGKIFVNYRRDDSASQALNVAQYLEREFGSANVFLDIDRLRAGQKFPQVLEERLTQSRVMLAVIGPSWLTVSNEAGERRLDDPEDWVRLEISRALARGIPVIPVLVGGAIRAPTGTAPSFNAMTARAQLPRSAATAPTRSGSTTCTAMCGNGWRTRGMTATSEHRRTARLGSRTPIPARGCFAAAAGAMERPACAPIPATRPPPTRGMPSTASVSCERSGRDAYAARSSG